MSKKASKAVCWNCGVKDNYLCGKCLPLADKALLGLPQAFDLALDLMAHPAPTDTERPSSSHPGISLNMELVLWRAHFTRLQHQMHRWVKRHHGLIPPSDTLPYLHAHLEEWWDLPITQAWIGEALGLYRDATWAGH